MVWLVGAEFFEISPRPKRGAEPLLKVGGGEAVADLSDAQAVGRELEDGNWADEPRELNPSVALRPNERAELGQRGGAQADNLTI